MVHGPLPQLALAVDGAGLLLQFLFVDRDLLVEGLLHDAHVFLIKKVEVDKFEVACRCTLSFVGAKLHKAFRLRGLRAGARKALRQITQQISFVRTALREATAVLHEAF